jgi:hypothetical protein
VVVVVDVRRRGRSIELAAGKKVVEGGRLWASGKKAEGEGGRREEEEAGMEVLQEEMGREEKGRAKRAWSIKIREEDDELEWASRSGCGGIIERMRCWSGEREGSARLRRARRGNTARIRKYEIITGGGSRSHHNNTIEYTGIIGEGLDGLAGR